ncbi:ABC transporter permease [bacterium]|nr:MAG: ABC transporter permease [bacterium]
MKKTLFLFQFKNQLRSKWVYIVLLAICSLSDLMLRFSGDGAKSILSLINLSLFFIPVIVAIQTAMFIYGNREYMELVLTQPVKRGVLIVQLWLAFWIPVALAIFLGMLLPFIYLQEGWPYVDAVIQLSFITNILAGIFSLLAVLISLSHDDKAKGLGVLLGYWLFLSIVYDGLMLFTIQALSDFSLREISLLAVSLNPVDLARILLLMLNNGAALLGVTGALFERFAGTIVGIISISSLLLIWFLIPGWLSYKKFLSKDF